jgi:hypothetical protein
MKRAAIFAALLSGCATNLAQMQTARALKQGELRVSGGVGIYIPGTQLGNFAAEGAAVAKQGIESAVNKQPFTLSDNQKRVLAMTSLALATLPPSPSAQLDVRYGLLPRLDIGLRYSIDSVRADAKLNFYHDGVDDPEDGLPRRSKDLALGFAVSKQLFKPGVTDIMGAVTLDNFDRWDVEVPLYVSIDVSRYFGVYGGGRYQFSHITFDQSVTTTNDCGCGQMPTTTVTKTPTQMTRHFYGGTAGIRVGSSRVSWLLELTVGNTVASANLLGTNVQMGGLTLYPATGIALTF